MEIDWLQHLFVFTAMVVTDFAYARWARRAANKQALRAALYAGLLLLCSAFVTTSYVENKQFVISAVIGAVFGTWVAIKYDKD